MKLYDQPRILDALGNDVVLGNHYGYSTRKGSWTTVTIGTAVNITARNRVTLATGIVKTYLYGKPVRDQLSEVNKGTTTITPQLMFPISTEQLRAMQAAKLEMGNDDAH